MEFASWSRDEQKSRLKEWNAKAKQLKATCQPCAPAPDTMRSDSTATTPAYLKNNDSLARVVKAPDEPLTSVAAIQASYKSRWRSDEAKRIALVKRTPKYQSWDRRRRQGLHAAETEPADSDVHAVDGSKDEAVGDYSGPHDDNTADVASTDTEQDDGVWVRNLSYAATARDPALKQHVLGNIRAALLQGKIVHVEADAQATGDSVSDARLLVQQLTIASLLFCDRTQELVPQTHGKFVSIVLVPKSRS